MYKKIVGIVVLTLLITTALPVIGLTNMKEIEAINGPSLDDSNRQITTNEKPLIVGNPGSLFIQLPAVPTEQWNAFFSDTDRHYRHYDEFWEISGPICDVHWWGFSLVWNGTHWVDCDGAGDMIFDITFYLDDGAGKPGDVACEYINISPTVISTGIYYKMSGITGDQELYYFEFDLDPCCQLTDGWLSVWKTYNPSDCIFAWMVCPDGNWNMWARNLTSGEWFWSNWDLSFILTDGEPDISDLECEGELRLPDAIPPGTKVSGNFTVRNNGDTESILHWKIESYPNWGDNWTITPKASLLTKDMGWLTVDVEFEAPPDKNKEFTGTIKLVNAVDSSDFCEINIYLKTPKARTSYNILLQHLFEHFPNLFPILRQLLGL